ncbi:hypothetical protein Tco_1292282 [Tanacetum coccineum]
MLSIVMSSISRVIPFICFDMSSEDCSEVYIYSGSESEASEIGLPLIFRELMNLLIIATPAQLEGPSSSSSSSSHHYHAFSCGLYTLSATSLSMSVFIRYQSFHEKPGNRRYW